MSTHIEAMDAGCTRNKPDLAPLILNKDIMTISLLSCCTYVAKYFIRFKFQDLSLQYGLYSIFFILPLT